ncbi:MAG TPA: hypothetical protein VFT88_03495 [Acidobacteriaceae bacterium]|jgi:hypothetical protein|nr:hypothetical protein [Acidobacteriaceae bacterium]
MTEQSDNNNKGDAEQPAPKRIGFMAGQLSVPDDFDTMNGTEIEQLFYGEGKSSQE